MLFSALIRLKVLKRFQSTMIKAALKTSHFIITTWALVTTIYISLKTKMMRISL
jgi:hypothetical protein